MNIDIIYLSDNNIPHSIPGFKKIREHSFQHNKTHVEIEVLSAEYLKLPVELVKQVIEDAVESNNMKIASKSGLVALKLFRGNRQDQADIEMLIKTGGVDITPYKQYLSDDQISLFDDIKKVLLNI